MSIITKMRRQKAVYWAFASNESGRQAFDSHGQPLYTLPVEIDCRWEDTAIEFVDKDGTRQVSRCRVFVDRDVKPGEVLMLGDLESGVDEVTPLQRSGAYEIRQVQKSPNLKASEFLRIAIM